MKSQALNHWKTFELMARLGLSQSHAFGVWSMLLMRAADTRPAGDVGVLSDQGIARMVDWHGEPAALVAALVDVRILDRVEGAARLVIHDWMEHCERSIHEGLARRGEYFWDGTMPSCGKMGGDERTKALALFRERWGQGYELGRPGSPARARAEAEREAQRQRKAEEPGQAELPLDEAADASPACARNRAEPRSTYTLTNTLTPPPPGAEPPYPPPQPSPKPATKARASARQSAALGSAWRAATTATESALGEHHELLALASWQPKRMEGNTLHVEAPSELAKQLWQSYPQGASLMLVELGAYLPNLAAVQVHVADSMRRRRGRQKPARVDIRPGRGGTG